MDSDLMDGMTVYNGSAYCGGCGCLCTPYEALYSQPAYCSDCKEARATKHVKGRMVS